MARSESRAAYKRRVLIDEITRRVRLMRDSEIDCEFAAIENALEVRIRFIAEPLAASSRPSKGVRTTKRP